MLTCKYCGGSGKLHDDADAFDDHEVERAEAKLARALASEDEAHNRLDLIAVERNVFRTELARVTAEAAVMRQAMVTLFDKIKHGDQAHKEWLALAIGEHFHEALSSTSAGAGLLKRLAAADAVCEEARHAWADDCRRLDEALEAWKRARGTP